MKLAGVGVLLAALLLYIAAFSVAADDAKKKPYDLLVLQLEWAPNECIAGTCADKPFGAFSVNQLVPTNADRENPSQEGDCPSIPYDASQISPEVQAELQCIFYNPSGSVEQLWQDLWDREGRCSSMSIGTFFSAITVGFNQRDVNAILASEGLVLPASNPGLDRDSLLDALDKNIARTFVQCDPATKRLRYVDICLDPKNLKPKDCPWWKDRYSQNPNTPGGSQCNGTLLMLPGAAPSPECQGYYPRLIPGAISTASVPAPPPDDGGSSGGSGGSDGSGGTDSSGVNGSPSSSSSSNVAAIAGGVVGGIVAAVAIVGAFLMWHRRSRRRQPAVPAGKAAPAHVGSSGGSLTDSFIPTGFKDVEAGGSLAGAALLAHKKSIDASLSSQSQGTGPRSAAAQDYAAGYGSLVLSTPKQEPLSPLGNSLVNDMGGRVPSASSAATAGSAAAVRPMLAPSQSALWLIRFEELTVTECLGAGSFGKVYSGEWNSTPVAIKLLLGEDGQVAGTPTQPSPMILKLEEEAEIMLSLRHPNIVSILGLCQTPPCIVLEYMERGSLTACLQSAVARPVIAAELTWQRRLGMLLDAAKGLTYLHNRSPPIIHRDLKSPNLLVDKHWRVKVTDFNLSKFMSESARNSSSAAMNPRWLAPEVMKGEGATRASDVFSFAVVMWEMLTWQLPYTTGNSWQVATHIMAGGRLPIPPAEQLPGPDRLAPAQLDAYVALMERCWQQARDARPSFAQIIADLRRILRAVENEGALEPAE